MAKSNSQFCGQETWLGSAREFQQPGNVVAETGRGALVRLCGPAAHWLGLLGCSPLGLSVLSSKLPWLPSRGSARQPKRARSGARVLFTSQHPSHLLSSRCPKQDTELRPESSVNKLGAGTAIIYLCEFKELKGSGETRE